MPSSSIITSGSGNETHRHLRLSHRPYPPIAVHVAVVDEPADLVAHPLAVVELQDLLEQLAHARGRLRIRSEQLIDRTLEDSPWQQDGRPPAPGFSSWGP